MLFTQTFAILAAVTPALGLQMWDRCDNNIGVCDTVAHCNYYHGNASPGLCPGLPNNVQCCYAKSCFDPRACPVKPITGRCPGGSNNLYCPGYMAFCMSPKECATAGPGATVLNGFCPGGQDNKLCRWKA
ncbi:uncharacterized protein LOC62_06G007913 [Vanrija pseudolonga]|uniref:Uncharacterized protein n=1 Tax=Vanrija pseudolonga TaxID=143232 RepID=A0AAF0YEE9_9TREE|nr:hypothetical protein LOC62_06G007913 [Vanrija pseudolonga]